MAYIFLIFNYNIYNNLTIDDWIPNTETVLKYAYIVVNEMFDLHLVGGNFFSKLKSFTPSLNQMTH